MTETIAYIKESLRDLYPSSEVSSLVRLIMERVCNIQPHHFLFCKDKELPESEKSRIHDIVERLKQMEPIQYILGTADFYSLQFEVDPSVLIPRPETEELVEQVILDNADQKIKILDIGTGSGCIAVTLRKHLKKASVIATDISAEALATARRNAKRNNTTVTFIQTDILDPEKAEMDIPFILDVIVSNPPYSIKWEGDENATLINDPRFSPAGVLAPKSKADLAFIMHALSWLATDGTAAIVCFPGVMYRGGAEKKIRKYLIDNNFIDCIIQLPDNLFFGTSIATCIMVLKKSKADNATLFIDASKQCVKVTNSNKLTEENIETILGAFAERTDKEHFARLVPNDEIGAQDYNLSVSTYVEQEDTREVINIVKLNAEIEQIVAREQVLREEISKIVAEIEG